MLQKENTNTYIFPRAPHGSDPRTRSLTYTLYSNINRNYLCPPFSPQLLKHCCIQCFLFSHALFIHAVTCEQTHELAHIMLTHRALNQSLFCMAIYQKSLGFLMSFDGLLNDLISSKSLYFQCHCMKYDKPYLLCMDKVFFFHWAMFFKSCFSPIHSCLGYDFTGKPVLSGTSVQRCHHGQR